MKDVTLILVLLLLSSDHSATESFPELTVGSRIEGNESVLHASRYGSSAVAVVSNGFLFVRDRYIPPPYQVQRIGQAIVVNSTLVNELFKGDPDETAEANTGWTSPMYGFKADTPRELADVQKAMLIRDLSSGGAIFIAAGAADKAHVAEMPVVAKWKQRDVQRVLQAITSDRPEGERLAEMRSLNLRGLRTEEEVKLFYDNSRLCTQLLHRASGMDQHPSPAD